MRAIRPGREAHRLWRVPPLRNTSDSHRKVQLAFLDSRKRRVARSIGWGRSLPGEERVHEVLVSDWSGAWPRSRRRASCR